MGEIELAAIFCALIAQGQPEVTHAYSAGYDLHRIRVDCETADEVFEIGLDKRSSLDSLQQALLAAHLTGKRPVVAIIDRDGRAGPYETRIEVATHMAGVEYRTIDHDFLIRLQMTTLSGDDAGGRAWILTRTARGGSALWTDWNPP